MKTKYGDNEILRFIYDEMSPKESEAFLDALTQDENLWARYEYFQETSDQVGSFLLEPSDVSIGKIMEVVKEEKPLVVASPPSKRYASLSVGLIVSTLLLMFFVARFGSDIAIQSNSELTQALDTQSFPTLVHEVRMDPGMSDDMSWNDQGIEVKMESIKRKAQSLSDDPLL